MRPSEELKKGGETILLIDDEEVVLIVTRRILRMLGYTVVTASSGSEAIEIYRSRQDEISLVILDMIMPGMSGREVFERLKRINACVRVILSSGSSVEAGPGNHRPGAPWPLFRNLLAKKLSEKFGSRKRHSHIEKISGGRTEGERGLFCLQVTHVVPV